MMLKRESELSVHVRGKAQKHGGSSCKTCRKSQLLPLLLGEAKSRPADCGSAPEKPTWFNLDKYKMAQAVFHRHFLCIVVSNLVGLLCLLAVETILRVLVFTGRSSVPPTSYKRYLSTLNHLIKWYSTDVFDKDSSAYKSLQQVRRMHISSHSQADKSQKFLTSQTDMVVTQWAFFGLVLTDGHKFGIHLTKEEEEALVHFWKIIGHLLGIDDKYNLALGSLEEVRVNCHALSHGIIIPNLVSPPPKFSQMGNAMLTGVHMIVPPMDPAATIMFTRYVFGIQQDTKNISWNSRLIYNCMIWNFNIILQLPFLKTAFRIFENYLLHLALYICNSLPLINALYLRTERTITSIFQGLSDSFMKVLKGILVLFNLESS